jgi:hypothetical protein
MNKTQLRHRVAEAKDEIKEVARNCMGNQTLESKGGVPEKFSARLKRRLVMSSKPWRTQRSAPDFGLPLF